MIRTGLPILVELINRVNSVIIFLSQITLLRWLTFLLGSQTVILIVLLFWIYFFFLTLVFVLQWLSLHCEILVYVVVSVSIDFPSNLQRDVLFHHIAYDYSRADCDSLRDHLRNGPWENIVKLSASAAASGFCEWVQAGNDVYLPHRKYQVKPYSSPCFSAACASTAVHRNQFFRL